MIIFEQMIYRIFLDRKSIQLCHGLNQNLVVITNCLFLTNIFVIHGAELLFSSNFNLILWQFDSCLLLRVRTGSLTQPLSQEGTDVRLLI